ncbi:hypothetical protein GOV04_03360 [Candidatus Woesearchaeota archaeon]|nr:hypothetical protein [Candidatus Woesearchaeota archaeon]
MVKKPKKGTVKFVKDKYKFDVMDTNISVKCSTKFKKDFFRWCKKHRMTPTEAIREHMFELIAEN